MLKGVAKFAMNKNILFINSSLSSGGSERVMTLLANQFCKNGYNVAMILLREKNDTYKVDSQVELIRFHYTSKNKFIIAVQRFRKLRAILKSKKYDVAISFMFDINIMSLFANLGTGVEMFISERADPMNRIHTRAYKLFENYVYKFASGIILQTQNVKSYYSENLQGMINVIPNPIDESLVEPYKGIRKDKVVAVGRMTEQKNFSLLIDTFSEFAKTHDNYQLEIYGDGELYDSIRNQINKLKIRNSVILKGYVSDVLDQIKDAKMYISTSNYEGISNSMLEAMALGIPCICTDCPVGGAAMVIDNGVNGFLIPMNDRKELLDRMIVLADNEDVSCNIGKESVKVLERFSLNKIAIMWENVINERLNRNV